ncbi:NADP-dependent malic enzyme-like [Tubulanus polymorphus]|uniref:NADP-dependent malic enzyme-like n=1 Tax=Tubulanus polymorphus TaxID=672921 RepID=UPI003DA69FC0
MMLSCLRQSGVSVRAMLGRENAALSQLAKNITATGKFSSTASVCRDLGDHHKDRMSSLKVRGIDIIRDPRINKGMNFSLLERQILGIHGLLPPATFNQDEQVQRIMYNYRRCHDDLEKYTFLLSLHDRNEKLFYRVVIEHVDEMMPIIYTPTVGLACQKYGDIFRRPRGLFISIHDSGHIFELLGNWPEHDVRAVVVTDGERILGLGDLGAYGMGIPVGKLSLYTALAGVPPHQCLPIVLDVGTDNDKLLNDPMYIGLPQKRTRGKVYDNFIDEFMEAIVKRYGQDTLIQFEDFANHNAFRFLEKYRTKYCYFNDDIQGTASVAVAGVIASLRITKNKLKDQTFVFQGAGEASIGIAKLLILAMEDEGISEAEALQKIWLVDSKGLIVKDRPAGGVSGQKVLFAKNHEPLNNLEAIVKSLKPTALIGAAGTPGVFTETILRDMASFNDRPIIFALSNPTSMSECSAEEAYKFTNGNCVFASGSPFLPVQMGEQTFVPGQGNNAYIFPGVALGSMLCGVRHITDHFFLIAAKAVADLVTDEHLDEGRVYPPLSQIREISAQIATKVAEFAYAEGLAATYPEPKDKSRLIRSQVYTTDYDKFLPEIYEWPIKTGGSKV